VRGLVYAEVTKDEDGENNLTFGDVKGLAGIATVSKSSESQSEAHYYDNFPAVVVNGNGADTVTLDVSAIPYTVLADLLGNVYDSDRSMYVEGERTTKYFALGYITKDTSGNEIYVWRMKGTFSIPDETNATEDNGTSANGQQIIYTGIATAHTFTNNDGKPAKAIYVSEANTSVSESTFFATVQTPDTVTKPSA
jgi:phi13 family phage major tail protein